MEYGKIKQKKGQWWLRKNLQDNRNGGLNLRDLERMSDMLRNKLLWNWIENAIITQGKLQKIKYDPNIVTTPIFTKIMNTPFYLNLGKVNKNCYNY